MVRQPPEGASESPRELIALPQARDRTSGGDDCASGSDVADRLAGLETLDLSAMRQEWRRLYRAEPPRLSRDLMSERSLIAFRKSPSVVCRRRRYGVWGLARVREQWAIATQSQPRIKPGARLVREWHGRTYSVIATEEGFQFEGKVYRSLTGIAREITGAGWSGPRFFGLAKAVNASEGVDAPLREVDIDDWAGGDPSQCVVASDA